jgi:hypothetical protein
VSSKDTHEGRSSKERGHAQKHESCRTGVGGIFRSFDDGQCFMSSTKIRLVGILNDRQKGEMRVNVSEAFLQSLSRTYHCRTRWEREVPCPSSD